MGRNLSLSVVAQMIKNLPPMRKTWVQSPGWEDPLKKGMATHSSILAWKVPWTEEPGRLTPVHGVTKSRTRNEKFSLHFLLKEENRGSERLNDFFRVTQLISGRVGV